MPGCTPSRSIGTVASRRRPTGRWSWQAASSWCCSTTTTYWSPTPSPRWLPRCSATSGDEIDVIYSDEDKLDELDRRFMPHFKPDWDPDLLLGYPYLGHLTAVRHDVLRRIGGFRSEFDGSQDYDVMLRATELARRVEHIPKVLYHWRVVAGSAAGDTDAKPWAHDASARVLEDALRRRGIEGSVEPGPFQGAYRVRRAVVGSPTVSVIIPFRDQAALTVACLASLERDAGYPIAEVVLVDNGSTEPETRVLRRQLANRPDTRVLDHPGEFNWAAINNEAAASCNTDLLLFLNNDIEADSPGWLHAMVEHAVRPEIGAVGARLLYPDGTLQHAGVVLGLGGVAGHLFIGMPTGELGYFAWDQMIRSYSAVTAACMMVRRSVFNEVGGFDEDFAVGFNDVDFCIRLARAGYRVLYTPLAELIHHESVSRGLSGYFRDYQLFLPRWFGILMAGDPHYNPNLSRLSHWCEFRPPGEDEEWLELVGGLIPAEDPRTVAPRRTAGVPDGEGDPNGDGDPNGHRTVSRTVPPGPSSSPHARRRPLPARASPRHASSPTLPFTRSRYGLLACSGGRGSLARRRRMRRVRKGRAAKTTRRRRPPPPPARPASSWRGRKENRTVVVPAGTVTVWNRPGGRGPW